MSASDIRKQEFLKKDPVLEMLDNAPLDDEPLTEEDLESLRTGQEEYEAGLTIPSEEIKRAFRERQAIKQ